MGDLLASELRLVLARRRTLALLAVLAAVPVLIAVAVELSSSPPQPGEGPPFLDQVTRNGTFVALTSVITSVPFLLPLALAVVAGDALAGESQTGTLRYLLLAPAGRTRLLAVKAAVVALWCLLAVAVQAAVGVAVGALLFPVGDVVLLSGDVVGPGEGLVRLGLVVAYAAVGLLGLAAVGLFASTLTDVGLGAAAATVVVAIAVQVLGSVPQLEWLHPWLLSRWWFEVGDLLREPVSWGSTLATLRLQAGWVLVFGALAWARFTTRDVLT